jgi:hypothetical protein
VTRDDHEKRVEEVLADAADAAKHNVGLTGLAACKGMTPRQMRRYLARHGRDDLISPLLANDESERISHGGKS